MFDHDEKIKRIVPPLKLCNQIPEGKFEDSLLVHAERFRNGFCLDCEEVIMSRAEAEESDSHRIIAPAPTLAEILEALRQDRKYPVIFFDAFSSADWIAEDAGLDAATYATTPSAAALKLWLEIYGKETEGK